MSLLIGIFEHDNREFAQDPSQQPDEQLLSSSQLLPTVDLGRTRRRKEASPAVDPGPASKPASCRAIHGARSVTGARTKNEDSFLVDAERHLWAVSDGIGGAPFGEVISRVSCNYLPRAWDAASISHPQTADRLVASIRIVDQYASELSDLLGRKGSGATLTIAHYDGNELTVASVGDSRTYLLRNSVLQQLGDDGRVSALSNALDQALGYHLPLKPDIASVTPQAGDVFVICSDGVWSTQSLKRMQDALSGPIETPEQMADEGNPQRMAYRLTEGADMSDNATAVVVLFVSDEEPEISTPSL